MQLTHLRGSLIACLIACLSGLVLACGKTEAPTTTPSGARASCAVDADCVVTSWGGCCACCDSEPHAIPLVEMSRQQSSCARKDCRACDENIECKKIERPEAFVARCDRGTCTAAHR